MQLQEDLAPVSKLARNSSLTQLRVFSRKENRGKTTYILNNGGETGVSDYGEFTANEKDGEVIMTPMLAECQKTRLVTTAVTQA